MLHRDDIEIPPRGQQIVKRPLKQRDDSTLALVAVHAQAASGVGLPASASRRGERTVQAVVLNRNYLDAVLSVARRAPSVSSPGAEKASTVSSCRRASSVSKPCTRRGAPDWGGLGKYGARNSSLIDRSS